METDNITFPKVRETNKLQSSNLPLLSNFDADETEHVSLLLNMNACEMTYANVKI